jgi:hypothetical protein|tara:strand:+ start:1144 stop:1317 length:174 start_codon:yes stop_codon:yes gene_type:complete
MAGKVSGYTDKIFTQDEVKDILMEITNMVEDLEFDYQRMSQSGKEIYDNLTNYLDKL